MINLYEYNPLYNLLSASFKHLFSDNMLWTGPNIKGLVANAWPQIYIQTFWGLGFAKSALNLGQR